MPPIRASGRWPARSASTTASSCATRWWCAAAPAPPPAIISAPATAASSTPTRAGSFSVSGWPGTSASLTEYDKGLPMATDAARAEDLTEQDLSENLELAEVIEGLARPQKLISPKYFYDERGSELFDAICEQPEYYPTQTEIGIMRDNIGEIADVVGPRPSVIEFGSGASIKIRILLSHLHDVAAYVPVDVSKEFLVRSANILAADYPDLEILPVAADFTKPFELPSPKIMPERNLVFFPGSTIGNFWPDSAVSLMKVMREEARDGGALLIGVDLVKDKAVLERAYNDAAGYTERFNLNMLAHLNRRSEEHTS